MQLRFVGCGDALGSGGRFNTCFHITGARVNFLIDCGASSLPALKRLGISGIDTIAIFGQGPVGLSANPIVKDASGAPFQGKKRPVNSMRSGERSDQSQEKIISRSPGTTLPEAPATLGTKEAE